MGEGMMGKVRRALGGVDCNGSGICSASRKIAGEAASAPAAPAVRWRNWRRDRSFFMVRSLRKFSVDRSQSTVRNKTKNESQTQTEIGTKAETGLVFLRSRIEIPPISIRNRARQNRDKSNPKEPGTTLKTKN